MRRPLAANLRRQEWFVGILWLVLSQTLLSPGLQALGLGEDLLVLNASYSIVCLVGTAVIFRHLLTESLQTLGADPLRLLKGMVMGFCLYELLQVGLGMTYAALLPDLTTPNDETISKLLARNPALTAVITVLLSPLVEETLYRGLLFGGLRNRNRPLAYLLSALLFAAAHLLDFVGTTNTGTLLWNIPLYALPALALCACYDYCGNLWGPIFLHMIINALAMYGMAMG